ncbi:MAG: BLUF domain-containing protein [Maricaulaceae bacterium]
MLSRLIYHSQATFSDDPAIVKAQLAGITQASGLHNPANGLSGALVYAGGVFVQALEGDAGVLTETFWKIKRDPRHRAVTLSEFRPIARRQFAGWGMRVATTSLCGAGALHRLAPAKLLDFIDDTVSAVPSSAASWSGL